MIQSKHFALAAALVLLVALRISPQSSEVPAISFGSAAISVGMTVAEVVAALGRDARHVQFAGEATALVYRNGSADPSGMEGQITFRKGRAIYVAYEFQAANQASGLAQQIAGAVDSLDSKVCTPSNYASHGTGGSLSETIFACGRKTFLVLTTYDLEGKPQLTNVEITIGALGTK